MKRAVSTATAPLVRKSVSVTEGLSSHAAPVSDVSSSSRHHFRADGPDSPRHIRLPSDTLASQRPRSLGPHVKSAATAVSSSTSIRTSSTTGEDSRTSGKPTTVATASSPSKRENEPAVLPNTKTIHLPQQLAAAAPSSSSHPLRDRHVSAPHAHVVKPPQSLEPLAPPAPLAPLGESDSESATENAIESTSEELRPRPISDTHSVSKTIDKHNSNNVDNLITTSHVTPTESSSADGVSSVPSSLSPQKNQETVPVIDTTPSQRMSMPITSSQASSLKPQPGNLDFHSTSTRTSVPIALSGASRPSLPVKSRSSLPYSSVEVSKPKSHDRTADKSRAKIPSQASNPSNRLSLTDHKRRAITGVGVQTELGKAESRPSVLSESIARRYGSGLTSQNSRAGKPLSAQTYVHQRRAAVAPKPSSHSMSSTPPIPATSPAARVRDMHGRSTYNETTNMTRISRTGFMERSVAAAVISAARNRTHSKRNRQPLPSKPPHHRLHGGFSNPWPSAMKEGGLRSRGGSGSRTFFHKVAKDRRPPDEQLATMLLLANRPDFKASTEAIRRDKYALASTWIGHSTFYLHARGLSVVTDPVWSARLGPLGPKRLVPPPCAIDDLPQRIDVVILSSACYDHYDKSAVQLLMARVGLWLVPLGVKSLLVGLGVKEDVVVELDWWDEHNVHGSRFVCTPAQHCSLREDTLWCSWVVHAPHHRFFYCGASGYRSIGRDAEDSETYDSRVQFGGPGCPAFKEIGHRFGPFDTAFLPIGGYKPRVVMSGVQGDAIDMLFVHGDLRARRSIAHRWGTFASNDEGLLDAVRTLEYGLQTGPVPEHEFCYLKHGRLHLT